MMNKSNNSPKKIVRSVRKKYINSIEKIVPESRVLMKQGDQWFHKNMKKVLFYINAIAENSYSPIIKSTYQRDVSPTFQKSENYKLIDSYEVRLMKLSSENG